MFNNMTKNIIQSTSSNRVYFKLLAHIVESHQLSPDIFVISKLPEFSEMDISFQFWSRIFHLIFSSSSTLKIKSGEKKLESSSFKIDYKIGCNIKGKFMTLSCVEIGRFVNDAKVRDDHHKLLLEGKVIINNIIKNFPFIDPNCIAIFNLQICGMKGDFIETILCNKKKYIAHRPLDRLRAPLHRNNNKIIDTFLRQLMYYKNHVETLCHDIEQMVNENDDKSASFGETLDTNTFKPPNFLDWIDDNVERL
ncbi:hypothetical protein BD560DRAFT_22263 [Blakeslea trispora]|nr:hypothetical protein BD560DRAFT_22263 [Blakeslea trispora]